MFSFPFVLCPTFHHFVYDDEFFLIFAVSDVLEYLFNGIDDSMSMTKDPMALLYTMIVDRGAVSNEHANAPPENATERSALSCQTPMRLRMKGFMDVGEPAVSNRGIRRKLLAFVLLPPSVDGIQLNKIDTLLASGGLSKNSLFIQDHANIIGVSERDMRERSGDRGGEGNIQFLKNRLKEANNEANEENIEGLLNYYICITEEVHGLRGSMAKQIDVLDNMASDFSKFTTWKVSSPSRMMDRVGVSFEDMAYSLYDMAYSTELTRTDTLYRISLERNRQMLVKYR
uniref:Uncharacterized protein n=1 Tax=Tanacetum cinerariifolium TaxID=118510 RepID=A0A699H5G8_TANCI|nr:hypothetical protein [Tanacetum cinerariifolium]